VIEPYFDHELNFDNFNLFTGRKSISAMHNIDNKTTSISKSYTNSKKEELLKVINEAKQKLENVSSKFLCNRSKSNGNSHTLSV
jgi:hypothetical protein